MSRHASILPTFAAVAILILLLIGAEIFLRGNFISPGNISALLLDNAYLLILAVGMTFVIVTGGIDLSVGSVMAFTGIWLAKMLEAGTSLAIAIPVVLIAGALVGLLIGTLVQFFEVQPFIASLAGLFLARGLAFVVSLSSIKVETTVGAVAAVDPHPTRRVLHHADRNSRIGGGLHRSMGDAIHPVRAHDVRDRR